MDDETRFRNMIPKLNAKQEYKEPILLKKRPSFATVGGEIPISINSYAVLAYPTKKVYQYDVSGPCRLIMLIVSVLVFVHALLHFVGLANCIH